MSDHRDVLSAADIDDVPDPVDGELMAALIELVTHLRMREGLPAQAVDRVESALAEARPHWQSRGGVFPAPVVSILMQVSHELAARVQSYREPEASALCEATFDLQDRLETAVWDPTAAQRGGEPPLPGLDTSGGAPGTTR